MRIAVFGYGGVGRALIRLIESKRQFFEKYGFAIKVSYVVEYYGGIYDADGIDLQELVKFSETEKDITKFRGGSSAINIDTVASKRDVDLAVIMTPTNKETGEPGLGFIRAFEGWNRRSYIRQRPCSACL